MASPPGARKARAIAVDSARRAKTRIRIDADHNAAIGAPRERLHDGPVRQDMPFRPHQDKLAGADGKPRGANRICGNPIKPDEKISVTHMRIQKLRLEFFKFFPFSKAKI